MIFFDIERKYIIAAVLLLIGLLAGGFILFRQKNAAGFFAAQISRTFGGGQWAEIKPRVGNDAGAGEASKENNGGDTGDASQEKKAAKAEKPAVIWCAQKNSDRFNKKVIINEVSWMGSAQSYSDEWIELKNMTLADIDLSGWQLQNKSQKIKISFGGSEVLPASGFYLLERTNDDSVPGVAADKVYTGSLGNLKEALYLFDGGCVVEDLVIAAGKWPAGDNTTKKTMIRAQDLSWQTSIQPGGTPKAENQ
jgi:hypothetical protein